MRYLPQTRKDRAAMLKAIGVGAIDDLFVDVPAEARLSEPLDLPDHQSELAVERALSRMAARNLAAGSVPSFLGGGAYRHHIPAAVDALIQRGEFLTAYTPYQPEISQGTLQALFEFQTQVALITGMEVANASMYDGATACAEAALMAARLTRRQKVILSGGLHPHYSAVTATLGPDLELVAMEPQAPSREAHGTGALEQKVDDRTAAVIVQYPDMFGVIRDFSELAEHCHDKGALLIVAVTEVIALGALTAPGAFGADIVVAEGQGLGVGLNFGGPYVGLFATRQKFVRQMPGRLAGETTDAEGRPGYVLTLNAREQHIRRDKATSNICTNSGLCALAFSIHLALLGEVGFTGLARCNHRIAVALADRLDGLDGVTVLNGSFFNEFTVRLGRPAAALVDRLAARGILAGVPVSRLLPDRDDLADLLLVAASETNTASDIEALAEALVEASGEDLP